MSSGFNADHNARHQNVAHKGYGMPALYIHISHPVQGWVVNEKVLKDKLTALGNTFACAGETVGLIFIPAYSPKRIGG
jgi:hypothetical protein